MNTRTRLHTHTQAFIPSHRALEEVGSGFLQTTFPQNTQMDRENVKLFFFFVREAGKHKTSEKKTKKEVISWQDIETCLD